MPAASFLAAAGTYSVTQALGMNMNKMLQAWDAWVLQRSPVVWQLRLHRFVPLAALLLLVWALTMVWLANPPRWLGANGLAANAIQRYDSPEKQAQEVLLVTMIVLGLLQALWWLASTRVHNRWRDHLPAGRFALWREWLLGALLCALLLAPLVLEDRVYEGLTTAQWQRAMQGQPVDAKRQSELREHVMQLETLVSAANAPFLPHWDAVADLPSTTAKMTDSNGLSQTLVALRLLKHGQVDTIAKQIAEHAKLLQVQGFVAADGGTARTQAQALVQAYRHNLKTYQPMWQAEVARQAHAVAEPVGKTDANPPAGTAQSADVAVAVADAAAAAEAAMRAAKGEADDAGLTSEQKEARNLMGRCNGTYNMRELGDWPAPEACLHALAVLPEAMRLAALAQQRGRDVGMASYAKWVHPRYGQAVFAYEPYHLGHLPAADDKPSDLPWQWLRSWSELTAWALACALALLAMRLLSWGQMAVLGASLVVTLTLSAWLGALGMRGSWMPAVLGLPMLGIGAWRVWRGRPWGDHIWLGCGLVISLILLGQAQNWLGSWLTRDGDPSNVNWFVWWSTPVYALGVVLLIAALAPVWRRWRSLAER